MGYVMHVCTVLVLLRILSQRNVFIISEQFFWSHWTLPSSEKKTNEISFLKLQVVDYRTHISGIRPKDIDNGEPFGAVQREVINLLKGRILVGHSVSNDLKVLHLKHPYK